MGDGLTLDVSVIDEAGTIDADIDGQIESLVGYALTAEGVSGDWTVNVALVSDEELRRLHLEFMGMDWETDILTFPLGEGERGGDIAVSVDRAADQAAEYGLTTWEEIRFLVVHGVLHLCGWDDASAQDRKRMLGRQAEILRDWSAS